jgi:spermidine synthase
VDDPDDLPRTIVRADTPRGEVALRERGSPPYVVHELVVSGVFAMDSVDTSTEVLHAERTLALVESPTRVLVGGLGLGFTAWSVLKDHRVAHLDVVEIEADIVDWARLGLTPTLAMVARHPRAELHVADVADVLTGASPPEGPWDVVLLDVDNGPSFLVHGHNEELYAAGHLAAALSRVRPGGVLAVWAAQREPELLELLGRLAPTEEQVLEVSREDRTLEYAMYVARRP